MSDLVERLYERHCQGDDLCGAAQKEIERLTAELKVWKPETASEGHGCPACGREYSLEIKLSAENERLRAVLEAEGYQEIPDGSHVWIDDQGSPVVLAAVEGDDD